MTRAPAPPAPPSDATLRLSSDTLDVVVLPDKGADIYAIIDRSTGVDVLFKTPWGWRNPATIPSYADSELDWLARYPGGWQLLVPNAGPARVVDGVERGYHGEAATVAWQLRDHTSATAELHTELLTAPLALHRSLRLTGERLHVRDAIRNTSPDPVELAIVHHPAFGAPFIGAETTLAAGAGTVITDATAPGHLRPDTTTRFPHSIGPDGQPVDLGRVQPDGEYRSLFAALTDFSSPWFALTNARLGFGIAMSWDGEALPHAWLWQEHHASSGHPWYRRASTFAVEPANLLPGAGSVGGRTRGHGSVLAGHSELVIDLALVRFDADKPVGWAVGQ